MHFVRRHTTSLLVCTALGVCGLGFLLWSQDDVVPTTATVERGDVTASIVVSGIARATEAARLGFPDNGKIVDILVHEGDVVSKGDILAILDARDLDADRKDAVASLSAALAGRDEVVFGATTATRDVASSSVKTARANVERVRTEEAAKVSAARATLYSSGLAMAPEDPETNDVAPTVSGTYACEDEGVYTVDVYASRARSGYSYKLSGLETGTFEAFDGSPGPLGDCGLYLQFEADETYRTQRWYIEIPNTRGASYQTNYNALLLAQENERNAVAAAEDALRDALLAAAQTTEPARNEALQKASSGVASALARIERVDALRERRIIRAPFDGTVTEVLPAIGEIATGNETVVSVLATSAFDVRARIPEIDITKITVGASSTLVFDAKDTEEVRGELTFISPLATLIDGVAYFDAIVGLTNTPSWMREGLNSDVRILTNTYKDALRVPRRFIHDDAGKKVVYLNRDGVPEATEVKVEAYGTDGYAVVDLPEGTVVVLPESSTP